MNKSEVLYGDLLISAGALVSHQLAALPETARIAVADAVNGGAHLELRLRLDDGGSCEIVAVPVDGSAPVWITRTAPNDVH